MDAQLPRFGFLVGHCYAGVAGQVCQLRVEPGFHHVHGMGREQHNDRRRDSRHCFNDDFPNHAGHHFPDSDLQPDGDVACGLPAHFVSDGRNGDYSATGGAGRFFLHTFDSNPSCGFDVQCATECRGSRRGSVHRINCIFAGGNYPGDSEYRVGEYVGFIHSDTTYCKFADGGQPDRVLHGR